MNILGMEEEQDNKKKKSEENKKKILISIVICAIFLVLAILCMVCFIYLESLTLKVYVDSAKLQNTASLVIQDENTGKTYLGIEQLAKLLGYNYYRGEYNSYSEDENSCYIKSTGITAETNTTSTATEEYTSFTAQSNKMLKVLSTPGDSSSSKSTGNKSYEIFSIHDPVQLLNGKLYIPIEEAGIAFNIAISYQENEIRIQSLKTLVEGAQKIAAQAGYTAIEASYRNQRAIASGMIVAQKDKLYGVIDFSGKDIIGSKYTSIQYVQNTQDFIVKSEEQYVGLLSSKGETILKPDTYDDISVLDENEKLYTVKKGTSFGVISSDGNVIIYPEYAKIGLDDSETFSADTSINTKMFFGNAIPVKTKDLKWRIFSYATRTLTKNEFDNFGYQTLEGDTKTESVLLIPNSAVGQDAIVVYRNTGDTVGYGLVNKNGEFIIPCVCSKIYATTTNGVKQYFIEYNNTVSDAKTFIEQNGSVTSQDNTQVDVGNQTNTQIITGENNNNGGNSLTEYLNGQNMQTEQTNEQQNGEEQQMSVSQEQISEQENYQEMVQEQIVEPEMQEQIVY